MTAEYKLVVRSAAGVKLAEVTDFRELSYRKHVNEPGLLAFALDGQHRLVALLTDKAQLEVWRRNAAQGIPWYCDFRAVYQPDDEHQHTDHETFTATCPGQLTRLAWRHVAYAANTANRTTFANQSIESIMKLLVRYNAASEATTANGRLRTPNSLGITVEADQGRGPAIDWNCAHKNLLATLQELAQVGQMDFDLIPTGPAAWEFRVFPGQRGVDRTATLTFALGYGNMAVPVYARKRIAEKTVAIVGGQGQEADRTFVVRTGPDYRADNDIETFVDGRGDGSLAALESSGDQALQAARAQESLSFAILQTPACLYGKHYCVDGVLGDLAVARYGPITTVQKLVGVTVALDRDGKETIDVETAYVRPA